MEIWGLARERLCEETEIVYTEAPWFEWQNQKLWSAQICKNVTAQDSVHSEVA